MFERWTVTRCVSYTTVALCRTEWEFSSLMTKNQWKDIYTSSPLCTLFLFDTRALGILGWLYSLQSSMSLPRDWRGKSNDKESWLWKGIAVFSLQIERACKPSFFIYIARLCEQKSKVGKRNAQNSFNNTGYHIPQFQQKYVLPSKYSSSVG